jgi:hypothetical protein
MPNMQIVNELDRCKTALQVVAEMQSSGLETLLDLLIECLDNTIGQVQAQLQQCTCQAGDYDLAPPVPLHRGILTVYQRPRPMHPES